jgi:hydroxymethylpyrimidine pyrophosphatase-like HAD family hydrolase
MILRQEVEFSISGFTGERYYIYHDIDSWIEACTADMQRILYSLDAKTHGTRIQRLLSPYDAVDITAGMPGKLEIVPKGVDKGVGMMHLCELYKLDPKNLMAIGDGANDIGMLQKAGLGIAMGNAVQSLFDVADAITVSNADDGFAKALYLHALDRG